MYGRMTMRLGGLGRDAVGSLPGRGRMRTEHRLEAYAMLLYAVASSLRGTPLVGSMDLRDRSTVRRKCSIGFQPVFFRGQYSFGAKHIQTLG
jgi:hypothetical protein